MQQKFPIGKHPPCRPIGKIFLIGILFICGENIVFIPAVYMYVVDVAQSFSSGFKSGLTGLVRGGIANDGAYLE